MTLMSEPMVRSSVLNFTASRCHERLSKIWWYFQIQYTVVAPASDAETRINMGAQTQTFHYTETCLTTSFLGQPRSAGNQRG